MYEAIIIVEKLKKEIESEGLIATADELLERMNKLAEIEVESMRQISEDKTYE